MTFNTIETSYDQGEPILLYKFALGNQSWCFTSADRPITYAGNTYEAISISRAAILQTQEIKQKTLKVTMPRDNAVPALFLIYPPSSSVMLTIFAMHYDDPDQQAVVDWMGRVMWPSWKGSTVELNCEPAYTSVQTLGLRRTIALNCPHVLFGPGCSLLPADFKTTGAISGVSNVTVSATVIGTKTDGYFSGGYLEWTSADGDYLERRSILSHSGDSVVLDYASPELAIGVSINLYPGCDHTTPTCNAKFNNILNYGGCPYIPALNPFGGGTIY